MFVLVCVLVSLSSILPLYVLFLFQIMFVFVVKSEPITRTCSCLNKEASKHLPIRTSVLFLCIIVHTFSCSFNLIHLVYFTFISFFFVLLRLNFVHFNLITFSFFISFCFLYSFLLFYIITCNFVTSAYIYVSHTQKLTVST